MSPSYCPSKQQSQSAMLSVTSSDIWSLSVFGGIIRPGQASHCVCFDLLLQRNLGMFDNCGTDRIDGEHSGTFWSVTDIAQSSPHILLDIINSSARSLSKSKDNKHNGGSSEFWWTATGPKFSEPQLVWTRLNIPAAKFLQIEQFAKLTKKVRDQCNVSLGSGILVGLTTALSQHERNYKKNLAIITDFSHHQFL